MTSDWPFDADAGDDAARQANLAEYTVSELSFALKRTLEDAYSHVRVRGELGRVSRPSSGHIYLDLKDDRAVISGVIWKTAAQRLGIRPEQGLEVIVTGRLTTFPGQSKYQIVIESMEPAGLGALMALLEERRRKLAAEGLFDAGRKRPLPFLPRVIGVVTSPTGAVIRDILHRLADRFPTRVIVWPVRVQGETCGQEVAAAIRGFNALAAGGPVPRPDLLIVARGGGSLEDLWGFSDEEVVRAAAASQIPLISAVGHETDWTLIDHAADERAPTPTAAAERAVPVRSDLVTAVDDLSRRQARALWRLLEERRGALRAAERGLPRLTELLALPAQRLDATGHRLLRALRTGTDVHRGRFETCASRLSVHHVARLLALPAQRLDAAGRRLVQALRASTDVHRGSFERCASRLSIVNLGRRVSQLALDVASLEARAARAVKVSLERRRALLETPARLLATLSYRAVLGRGYALVHSADGAMVRSVAEAVPGIALSIEFHDGKAAAHVDDGASARPVRPRPRHEPGSGQGNLF